MSASTDPDGASERVESAPHTLSWAGRAWWLIADTTATCVRYRVTGLAAEAAFFGVLSLPPLLFGLAGAIGFFTSTLDIRTLAGFRGQLVDLSSRVLTPDVVHTVIEPTIDDVFVSLVSSQRATPSYSRSRGSRRRPQPRTKAE